VQYWRTVGYYRLEGMVPVDWFEVPCGSPEMAKIQADADSSLSFPLAEYVIEGDEARDFPDDDEMVKEFIKPKLCTKPHWQVSQPLDPSSEAIFSHKSDFGRSGRGVGGLFYRANGKAKPYLSKRDRPLPCSPGYCQCHLE